MKKQGTQCVARPSNSRQQTNAAAHRAQLLVTHVLERWRPSRSGSWAASSEDAAFPWDWGRTVEGTGMKELVRRM